MLVTKSFFGPLVSFISEKGYTACLIFLELELSKIEGDAILTEFLFYME